MAALGNPNISKDLLHKILSGESDFKINHTWKIKDAVFNNPSLDDQFLSKYITPARGESITLANIFSHPVFQLISSRYKINRTTKINKTWPTGL